MIACGGSGGNTSRTFLNPISPTAQGVFSGTLQGGNAFEAIVTPDDKVYVLHGAASADPNVFLVDGLVAGQGASNSGRYTASVTDFFGSNPVSGSLTATYVPATSFTGTIVAGGTTIPFSGTAIAGFDVNTAASLSTITGTWIGTLMFFGAGTITIDGNGKLSGNAQGCTFSGTVKPDTSGKNFFTLSVTFGSSPCTAPFQTETGVVVDYLLSNGTTRQLVAAATSGNFGAAFAANR